MFNIPEVILIGSFLIPIRYALFAVIGYLATYSVYTINKPFRESHKLWTNILVDGFIAYVLVWKFSVILTSPLSVINNPSMILLGSGGFLGSMLGILAGILVIWRSAQKKEYPYLLFFDFLMYWLVITLTVYWMMIPNYGLSSSLPWAIQFENSTLSYHPIHGYKFLLGGILLLYVHIKKLPVGRGMFGSHLLFFWGIGLLLISNLQYHTVKFFGLTSIQWLYVTMIIIGLLVLVLTNRIENVSKT